MRTTYYPLLYYQSYGRIPYSEVYLQLRMLLTLARRSCEVSTVLLGSSMKRAETR